jgi:zinc/manganese transport system substrate-binding protein
MLPHLPHRSGWRALAPLAALGLVLAACGTAASSDSSETEAVAESADAGDDGTAEASDAAQSEEEAERLQIVATTSIIGDIVSTLVQDDAEVTVIMPPGADPHGFEPSASDGRVLREADLVVANGLMLEESLVSVLDAVEEEGGNVFTLADKLDPIPFGGDHAHSGDEDDHGHGDEDDHGHGDEDDHGHGDGDDHGHGDGDDHGHGDGDDHGHGDEDDHGHGDEDDHGHGDEDDHAHDHGSEDPHFWFDPLRAADGVLLLAAEIAALDTNLDAAEWTARAEAYADELREIDAEMAAMFETIPADNRILVTNHDALGYLADRYDFTILGTVVPGASTQAETDSRSFAALIEAVESAGVEVVFAENTDSTVLAEQLASEVVGRGDLEVEVVRLYTDGLGEPGSGAESYLGLLRTTTGLITEALGGSL